MPEEITYTRVLRIYIVIVGKSMLLQHNGTLIVGVIEMRHAEECCRVMLPYLKEAKSMPVEHDLPRYGVNPILYPSTAPLRLQIKLQLQRAAEWRNRTEAVRLLYSTSPASSAHLIQTSKHRERDFSALRPLQTECSPSASQSFSIAA